MLIKKKYTFFSRRDKKKEPLGIIEANSLNEATKFFSTMKDLPENAFLNIYNIQEYDKRGSAGTKQMLFG